MMEGFDKSWEDLYSQGKNYGSYPYDIFVSTVAKNFFYIPKEERGTLRVLDLGCAAGNNAKFLAENGFSVFGIDGSASIIKTCRERFVAWGLRGDFVEGDLMNLPYEDEYFGLIIDRESIYANRLATIREILSEVHRTLKTGGLFVSFIYTSFHPDIKFGKQIEPNTYDEFSEGSFHGCGIAHFVSKEELLELYSKFTIEHIMRHSLAETHNKEAFMEFDEYIVICRK